MNIIKHPVWILFWGNPCDYTCMYKNIGIQYYCELWPCQCSWLWTTPLGNFDLRIKHVAKIQPNMSPISLMCPLFSCLLYNHHCTIKIWVSKLILHAVTERAWEEVSTDASADEEEKLERSDMQIKTEKQSPPKQTKQASLISFFKR